MEPRRRHERRPPLPTSPGTAGQKGRGKEVGEGCGVSGTLRSEKQLQQQKVQQQGLLQLGLQRQELDLQELKGGAAQAAGD